MTSSPSEILSRPLSLPCGAVLSNRLCKAAMTEGLADVLAMAAPDVGDAVTQTALDGAITRAETALRAWSR